jgi:hypothetical protein
MTGSAGRSPPAVRHISGAGTSGPIADWFQRKIRPPTPALRRDAWGDARRGNVRSVGVPAAPVSVSRASAESSTGAIVESTANQVARADGRVRAARLIGLAAGGDAMLAGDLVRADQAATAGVSWATDLAAGAAGNTEATLAGATWTRRGVGHGDAVVVLASLATAARATRGGLLPSLLALALALPFAFAALFASRMSFAQTQPGEWSTRDQGAQ